MSIIYAIKTKDNKTFIYSYIKKKKSKSNFWKSGIDVAVSFMRHESILPNFGYNMKIKPLNTFISR